MLPKNSMTALLPNSSPGIMRMFFVVDGMDSLFCFIDESYSGKILCLGGVIIHEEDLNHISSEINQFKQLLGLKNSDYIKFSLGDNREDKKIKEKIKIALGEKQGWLTTFRCRAIEKIASFNLTIISSLHQDVRKFFRKQKSAPIDFYLTAFKFLIQRIWWITKDFVNPLNVIIILDNPPGKNALTKICKLYKKAFYEGFSFPESNSRIPPLKDYGFFESPVISKSDYNSFIQISDFCAGAIKERAKDLLKNNIEGKSKKFLKILYPKIYKTNNEDIIGKGIVVFPRDRELYLLIKQDVETIQSEEQEEEVPF